MSRVRFGFTTGQKVILWAGLLLCIWRFLQVPAVFDAILKFYAAGQVPGTDIVLTPDESLRMMAAGLCIVLAAIVYVTKVSRPRPLKAQGVQLPVEEEPIAVIEPSIPEPKKVRGPRFVRLRALFVRVRQLLVARFAALLTVVLPRVSQAAAFVRFYARMAWRITCRITRRITVMAMLAIHDIWIWFLPYAHRFDAWLREVLNGRQSTATAIQFLREVWKLVQEAWKKIVALNHRAQMHTRE